MNPIRRSPAARRLGPRRRLAAGVWTLLLLFLASPPAAVPQEEEDERAALAGEIDPIESERLAAALAGIEEQAGVNARILEDAARKYRAAVIKRNELRRALDQAQEALDREATHPLDLSVERLEELQEAVRRARVEAEIAERDAEARLREIARLIAERNVLAARVAELRAKLPETRELLTGVWEVRWLPQNSVGTFYLDQSGTLVTGRYRFGTMGSGSLQGTFVGGKVFLQRIDAERGRDAELEGALDPDGTRIRGTWQMYELVQGGLPRGHWVARRIR